MQTSRGRVVREDFSEKYRRWLRLYAIWTFFIKAVSQLEEADTKKFMALDGQGKLLFIRHMRDDLCDWVGANISRQ